MRNFTNFGLIESQAFSFVIEALGDAEAEFYTFQNCLLIIKTVKVKFLNFPHLSGDKFGTESRSE